MFYLWLVALFIEIVPLGGGPGLGLWPPAGDEPE